MASAVGARSDGKKGVGGRRPISSRADLVASRSWPLAGRGPVAQLVEQCVYTASVVGSSPAGSTTVLLFFTTAQKTPCTSGQIGSRVAVGVAKSESRRGPFGVGCGRAGQN